MKIIGALERHNGSRICRKLTASERDQCLSSSYILTTDCLAVHDNFCFGGSRLVRGSVKPKPTRAKAGRLTDQVLPVLRLDNDIAGIAAYEVCVTDHSSAGIRDHQLRSSLDGGGGFIKATGLSQVRGHLPQSIRFGLSCRGQFGLSRIRKQPLILSDSALLTEIGFLITFIGLHIGLGGEIDVSHA